MTDNNQKINAEGNEDVWAALNRIAGIMEQHIQANVRQWEVRTEISPPNPQNEFDMMLDRFLKMGPLAFQGQPDADMAETWTIQMEKIFETLRCNDTDKVKLAVFKLKDEAEYWWRMIKRKGIGEQQGRHGMTF